MFLCDLYDFIIFCKGEAAVECYSCAFLGCGDPFSSDGVSTENGCNFCLKVKEGGKESIYIYIYMNLC